MVSFAFRRNKEKILSRTRNTRTTTKQIHRKSKKLPLSSLAKNVWFIHMIHIISVLCDVLVEGGVVDLYLRMVNLAHFNLCSRRENHWPAISNESVRYTSKKTQNTRNSTANNEICPKKKNCSHSAFVIRCVLLTWYSALRLYADFELVALHNVRLLLIHDARPRCVWKTICRVASFSFY